MYEEEIIVYVIFHGEGNWYKSDRELWFMDEALRTKLYERLGYKLDKAWEDERRRDLEILDTENAHIFLERIKECKAATHDLRIECHMAQKTDCDWKYTYMPSLYVNFDKKEFYSLFSEPESYEDYVPQGWNSEYKNFLDLIPEEEHYWE